MESYEHAATSSNCRTSGMRHGLTSIEQVLDEKYNDSVPGNGTSLPSANVTMSMSDWSFHDENINLNMSSTSFHQYRHGNLNQRLL